MKLKISVALLAFVTAVIPLSLSAEDGLAHAVASRNAAQTYANLPLRFEPAAEQGHFMARSSGYAVLVGAGESAIAITDGKSGLTRALRFSFEGSNAAAQIEAIEALPGVTNYYIGSDPKNWRLGVRNFAKLRTKNVYPGVDIVYYGDNRRLEFDFVVAPAADPRAIALGFSGMDKLYVNAEGELVAEVNGNPVRFAKPYAYQKVAGSAKAVSVEYALAGPAKVQLRIGDYDKNLELVIDPTLTYSTYLGGEQGDQANGIAVDSTGHAYITGQTCSSSFLGTSNPSGCSAFVTELNPTGTAVLFTTIIGGNNTASGNAIALDSLGEIYIAGTTNSNSGLPRSTNTYQGGDSDAFIAEIAAGGTLIRTAYLGGSGADTGYGVAVDSASPANVIVAGQTCSSNFPAYSGFEDKVEGCVAFVTKLDNNLTICTPGARYAFAGTSSTGACYFSLYYGGQPPNVPFAGGWQASRPYLSGDVITVTYLSVTSSGETEVSSAEKCIQAGTTGSSQPTWSSTTNAVTTDGGVWWQNEGNPGTLVVAATQANGAAVDPLGDVFATGGSSSQFIGCSTCGWSNYIGAGAWMLKVSGLSSAALVSSGTPRWTYSTVLGTTITDVGNGIAVDTQGRAYVVGTSTGGIFTTKGAYQPSLKGEQNAFILQMNTAGSAIGYATYLGGSLPDQGLAIAVDSNGAAYVTGSTKSTDFPVTNPLTNPDSASNAQMSALSAEENAFVAKFIPGGSALAFSTYLGGTSSSDSDYGTAIAVYPDANDNDMYVAGVTNSSDFPVYPQTAYQTTYGNSGDAFAAVILGKTIPNVAVSPTLSFSPQTEYASTTLPVKVTNTGTTPLIITNIQITQQTTPGDFGATYTCGSTLAANTSCTITVTFSPQALGPQTGTLTITDNGSNSPQYVALTGTGTALVSSGGGGGGAASTGGFSLTPSTTALVVIKGTPTPFNVILTTPSGFTGTVALACAPTTMCTITSTNPIQGISGTTSYTATVTVNIPVGNTMTVTQLMRPGRLLAMLLPFGGIGLVLAGRRKRWLLAIGLAMCLALVMAACGGGSSSSGQPQTLTVTATAPDGSQPTATVALTVQ